MKIPNKIQIAGKTVKVKFIDNYTYLNGGWGESRFKTSEILISNDLVKQEAEITFIHEVLHFIFEAMGEFELKDNEKIVHGASGYLHQVIKQL